MHVLTGSGQRVMPPVNLFARVTSERRSAKGPGLGPLVRGLFVYRLARRVQVHRRDGERPLPDSGDCSSPAGPICRPPDREIFVGGSYRPGAAAWRGGLARLGHPLLRHLPRWHHQHRGIRCECPIHAAGTTWLGHPRRINGGGSSRGAGSPATTATAITPQTPGPEDRPGRPRGQPVTPDAKGRQAGRGQRTMTLPSMDLDLRSWLVDTNG